MCNVIIRGYLFLVVETEQNWKLQGRAHKVWDTGFPKFGLIVVIVCQSLVPLLTVASWRSFAVIRHVVAHK
jgi:hypothetical protein